MAQAISSISALLISVALTLLGNGLQSTLLPLAAQKADFSNFAIGLISSAYYIGMVLGCLLAPFLIMRSGHIRAFAALVSVMSAAAILHPVFITPVAWFIIRFLSGLCLAGFYMIVESWLNEAATNENRGTIMSLYIVVMYAAMMVGQVSIADMDITSFTPFVIASVAVSIAVVPVALTTANQPAPITLVRFRPMKLYRNSPAAFVGVLLVGWACGALWSLAPLYGSLIGMETNQAAFYAAAIVAGGVIAQWPIGRMSDKVDRRLVLMGLGIATALAAFAIIILHPTDMKTALILALVVGAFSQPGYSIAVSHAYDYADPDDYVETSSGLLLSYGIGSVAGPLSASLLIDYVGASGLYLLVAVVELVMAAFIVTRVMARKSLATDEKTDFEYASTAHIGSVLTPEPLDLDNPAVIAPEEFPAYEDISYIPGATSDEETPEDKAEDQTAEDPTSPEEEEEAADVTESEDETATEKA